ncbi:MAG: hypothetical protein ACK4E2_04185, partial [Pseudothermotoga sp.]
NKFLFTVLTPFANVVNRILLLLHRFSADKFNFAKTFSLFMSCQGIQMFSFYKEVCSLNWLVFCKAIKLILWEMIDLFLHSERDKEIERKQRLT